MKTIIFDNNTQGASRPERPVWYFLPDSALSNAGKPLFIPENETCVEALLAPAVRVTRLGKSIAPRFGSRYYSEIAPAIHFRIPGMRRALLMAGLPPDCAQAFDRSLIIGDYIPFPPPAPLTLSLNGEVAATWDPSAAPLSADEALSAVSSVNTMKMGDILIPSLSASVDVYAGDSLDVSLGNTTLLSVKIK